MTDFVGRVDSVYTRQFTASIATSASAGATTLTVVDGDDLDPSGQVLAPWDGTVYSYEFDGVTTVTLSAPLTSTAEVGEVLVVWDPATGVPVVDTVAHVAVLGAETAEDVVEARVSFPLIPLLSEGIRDEGTAEAVTVRTDGSDYVVAEVLGQAAKIDGSMIDPETVPPASTDGLAPASNPAVTLRPGIGSLFVVWDPIDNADPVSYDIYAVPAADAARLAYPPLASDLVGTSDGTGAGFRALPDGTVLSPASSYAVAVYARDKDGTCTTSATPVTGSPAQVNSQDLALNALTTDHLTANNALFIALQAEDIDGVNITGSTITGTEIKTAASGTYWRLSSPGDIIRLSAVPSFEADMAEVPSLSNLSIGNTTEQIAGTALTSGAFSGTAKAGIQVSTGRTRPTASDPWSTPTLDVDVNGNEISVLSNPVSGPGSIVIDAKNDEGAVSIHGDHINISTYAYGGDSVDVSTGVLTLSGDERVAINGPTATLNGSQIATVASDSGWIAIPLVSGYTAYSSSETPSYRKIGNLVYLRGRVQGSYTTANTVVGNLPDGYRPAIANEVRATTVGSTVGARFFVTAAGALNINSHADASGPVSIGGSYLID